MQRFDYCFDHQADFILTLRLWQGQWVEVSRWMIPGTQLED